MNPKFWTPRPDLDKALDEFGGIPGAKSYTANHADPDPVKDAIAAAVIVLAMRRAQPLLWDRERTGERSDNSVFVSFNDLELAKVAKADEAKANAEEIAWRISHIQSVHFGCEMYNLLSSWQETHDGFKIGISSFDGAQAAALFGLYAAALIGPAGLELAAADDMEANR